MLGPWLVTVMLEATAPDVRLAFDACDRVQPSAVERHVAIELRQRPLAVTHVFIRCDEATAHLIATAGDRRAESTVAIADVPGVALARTLALSAVELVFAAQPPPVPKPASPPPTPRPPERRVWLRAGGGVEITGVTLATARVSTSVSVARRLAVAWDVTFARGSESFAQGTAIATTVDATITLQVIPRAGRWLFPVGAGARLGGAWLAAQPNGDVDAGTVDGLRWGPAATVGAHVATGDRFTLGVDLAGGWHARGLRGFVDGQPRVELTGPWCTLIATVGTWW